MDKTQGLFNPNGALRGKKVLLAEITVKKRKKLTNPTVWSITGRQHTERPLKVHWPQKGTNEPPLALMPSIEPAQDQEREQRRSRNFGKEVGSHSRPCFPCGLEWERGMTKEREDLTRRGRKQV
ncbi:hypothetical protein TNIN_304361 [Trichonephila inaurata madagascariensis]|uniref:Uncharacterized protein n=1 Tax=Trichonephila inaurata madagascariensis TaxID=2747483 RepID=A0A8X6MBV7_9ARAC|nr:hypothetical protein TNIN_304361 [Trichonephila inaurata madagascariensis]